MSEVKSVRGSSEGHRCRAKHLDSGMCSLSLSIFAFSICKKKNWHWSTKTIQTGGLDFEEVWLFSLSFFLDSGNQVDNTGMLEFQEFKVFWEKMKKWIVRVGSCVLKLGMMVEVSGSWFRLIKRNLCCYRCCSWPLTPTDRERCRPMSFAALSMLQVRVDH